MTKKINIFLSLILAAAFNAYAEAPNLLTYQGRLKEAGQAVTGSRTVEILLCDDETAGTCHTSGAQPVAVSNGLFRSTFAIPGSANFGAGNWWLEIKVGADTLAPREQFTSNAYAMFAATAAYASNIAAAEGSDGVYISSNLYVTGGGKYYGDGSALSGLPAGDNLGNHNAGQNLQLNWNNIYTVSTITAAGHITAAAYQVNGTTVLAAPGTFNIYAGLEAGNVNTGDFNAFFGQAAGYSNAHADGNTFIGSNAGLYSATGENNAAVGRSSLHESRTGSGNAVVGSLAGFGGSGLSFSSSVVMGYKAGYVLEATYGNTLIGFQAGDSLATGSRNIIIGYDQDATAPTISDELNIGGLLRGNLNAGTIGIGFANTIPLAALDVKSTGTAPTEFAQVWRDGNGNIISSVSAAGVMMASGFVGDGSGITGISAVDSSKVARIGDTMTGQLTLAGSTLTVSGNDGKYGLQVSSGVSLAGLIYTSNDNVGIGTASPSSKLHVVGDAAISGAVNSVTSYGWYTTGAYYGSLTGQELLANVSDGGFGTSPFFISAGRSTNYGAGIAFKTSSDFGAPTERMRIDKDGNVGISTVTPQGLFQVGGGTLTVLAGGNVGIGTVAPVSKLTIADGDLRIATGGKGIYFPDASFMTTAGVGSASNLSSNTDATIQADADLIGGGSVTFKTGAIDAVTITSDGSVGIGTATPGSKLAVMGGDLRIVTAGKGIYFPDASFMTTAGVGSASNLSSNGEAVIQSDADLSGAENIVLRTGAVDAVVVNSAGSVGISGSITANSSGTFKAFGATQYSLLASSGIKVSAGSVDVTGYVNVSGRVVTPAFRMATGASNNYVLITDASGNASWADPASGSLGDGWVGNELTDAANTTLTRSGLGTSVSPYEISLNLGNANTWTANQTFSSGLTCTNCITLSAAGSEVTGTLPLANGGTGAGTAATARSNLGAAASGANSDITSLSGLTTALSAGQGGTGATSLTSGSVLVGNGTGAVNLVAGVTNIVTVKGSDGIDCNLTFTNGVLTAETCP